MHQILITHVWKFGNLAFHKLLKKVEISHDLILNYSQELMTTAAYLNIDTR